jgi:hypothetical protein
MWGAWNLEKKKLHKKRQVQSQLLLPLSPISFGAILICCFTGRILLTFAFEWDNPPTTSFLIGDKESTFTIPGAFFSPPSLHSAVSSVACGRHFEGLG